MEDKWIATNLYGPGIWCALFHKWTRKRKRNKNDKNELEKLRCKKCKTVWYEQHK